MAESNPDDPPWYINRQRKVHFDQNDYEAFLVRLYREVAGRREFAVVVACDAALRRANRQFRGRSTATDVLSFPDGEKGRLGDILIAAGRAERQAACFGHSVELELKVLVLHGLLHLMGYDHETDDGGMRRVETRWRRKLGLPAGLVERAES